MCAPSLTQSLLLMTLSIPRPKCPDRSNGSQRFSTSPKRLSLRDRLAAVLRLSTLVVFVLILTGVGPVSAQAAPGWSPSAKSSEGHSRSLRPSGNDINAKDYGAVCDGVHDDAPAFNAAVNAVRAATAEAGNMSWLIGRTVRLTAPKGVCRIRSTINFTGIYGSGIVVDFYGTSLHCETDNQPCLDATGAGQVNFLGLNIHGSEDHTPSIGVAIGRISDDGVGADHNLFEHPDISGFFKLAALFNNQSETTLFTGATFHNQQADAFGAIFDGENHFGFQSHFTSRHFPKDKYMSFNENTCVQCIIGASGTGGTALWIGGTARLSFINGYVFNSPPTAQRPRSAIVLYYGQNLANDLLNLDVHIENNGAAGSLSSAILFAGAQHVVQNGLRLRDHYIEQSGAIFARDRAGQFGPATDVVDVTDADIEIGRLAQPGATWWDAPGAFRVSGKLVSATGDEIWPNVFSGTTCTHRACNTFAPSYEPETLPPCTPQLRGMLAVIAKARMPAFNRPVMGGGEETVLGLCNGATWTVH